MKKLTIAILFCAAFAAQSCNDAFAGTETIIDFIVANSPELQELKSINRNILNQLKIEAKGSGSFGRLTQEGTSTIERAQARYNVAITASIPLISPGERAHRRIEEAAKERSIRLEAAELIKAYMADLRALEGEEIILSNHYKEVQWIGRRVQSGVDTQKDYNQKLNDYLTRRKDHEIRKEQTSLILEKILSYVEAGKRNQLKETINAKKMSKD